MTTISERLRSKAHDYWFGPPANNRLEWKAADTIDALVEVAEIAKIIVVRQVREDGGIDNCDLDLRMDLEKINAALSKAKGKQE